MIKKSNKPVRKKSKIIYKIQDPDIVDLHSAKKPRKLSNQRSPSSRETDKRNDSIGSNLPLLPGKLGRLGTSGDQQVSK